MVDAVAAWALPSTLSLIPADVLLAAVGALMCEYQVRRRAASELGVALWLRGLLLRSLHTAHFEELVRTRATARHICFRPSVAYLGDGSLTTPPPRVHTVRLTCMLDVF